MSCALTVSGAAAMLSAADDILVLLHQYPDGDTVGGGYALALALRSLGKRVAVACHDPIPEKYAYLTDEAVFSPIENPQFICAVDVADVKLLGSLATLGEKADLCIDHHATNTAYAKNLLLDSSAGAACMVVRQVIAALGVPLSPLMAECLYTGLATDTGCFKYANTTPAAHELAAELIGCGVRHAFINEMMFERKSRARLALEQGALAGMQFFFDGRVAVMTITTDMIRTAGADENDMEGLAPIPRQIEGVLVGVTMRQKADGGFKISLRTGRVVDASAVAAKLGGGGHPGAAGCSFAGDATAACEAVLAAIAEVVPTIRN